MPDGRLAIMADDMNYGSLGALAPSWSDGERNIDTDEIYERFFEWVADIKGVEPWPHQEEAIMDLARRRPCHFEHTHRLRQITGGVGLAFRGAVHGPSLVLHGSDQGVGV